MNLAALPPIDWHTPWYEREYASIPDDAFMVRVYWHASNLRAQQLPGMPEIDARQAYHQAVGIVKRENLTRDQNFANVHPQEEPRQ